MRLDHLGLKAGMLIFGAVAILAAGCAPPPASLSESDMSKIRQATEAYATAASNNDWATVSELYANDAVLMPPNEATVNGRAAILSTFQNWPPTSALTLDVVKVEGSGDLAYVHGTYAITMDMEGQMMEDRGKYLEIRRKMADGSWPIIVDTWNSDMPMPGQESMEDEM